MKSLKPSMREKKRYVLLRGENLKEDVEKSLLDFVGTLGLAKVGLKFIKTNKKDAIISINRESLNHVRASFVVFPKQINVVKVSGSIKGLGR